MRRLAASTVAVSCVCQTHQLRRYLKRHPRRSMLLPPHARQRCLANCRSRAGSSLLEGRCGRKGTEIAHGSVLFQRASPPQHAKFHWMFILPRRQLRMDGIPHHRTMSSRGSRSLMADSWASKYTWAYCAFAVLSQCPLHSSVLTASSAAVSHIFVNQYPKDLLEQLLERDCDLTRTSARCHLPLAASSRFRRSKQSRHS